MAVAIAGSHTLYLQHLEGDNVVKCATELVIVNLAERQCHSAMEELQEICLLRLQDRFTSQVQRLSPTLWVIGILIGGKSSQIQNSDQC